MNEERLQIISTSGAYGNIKSRWLFKTEKATGRRVFYHPDCEIWLLGRNTSNVKHVIMQSLQDKNMHVRELYFSKSGLE